MIRSLVTCVRAIPEFVVWKVDAFTAELHAQHSFGTREHDEARTRAAASFARFSERIGR